MKKKPSEIFSILINTLNNLDNKKQYSINEISEKSGLHWQTVNEYLKVLTHIQIFSPIININESNKVQITNHSKFLKNLAINQKILLTLYENKAFDENSSLKIENFILDSDLEIYLEELIAKDQIKISNRSDMYYITNNGKINVISLYSEMSKAIFDIYNTSQEISENAEFYEILNYMKQQNKFLINQYNELQEQNRMILILISSLIKGIEQNLDVRTDLDLPGYHHEPKFPPYLHIFDNFQPKVIKHFKKSFQTNEESNLSINFNIKRNLSSDFEVLEDFNDIECFLKFIREKSRKSKNIEVIK